MNTTAFDSSQKTIYLRLIALWAVCEAFAGGIMHGIKIPFSGLVISSMAMVCIILIAYHISDRNAIIKATLIVAVFKMMLSPHSPAPAYIAVFFQGILGHFLFYNRKHFVFSAITLGLLGSIETAIQRILVMVILYGNTFWKAFNSYISKLTGEHSITNYALTLAILYIIVHAITGIAIGFYGSRIAQNSLRWKIKYSELIFNEKNQTEDLSLNKKKRKLWLKGIMIFIWLFLFIAFIQTYLNPSKSILSRNDILMIVLRFFFIITTWILILSPLLSKWMNYFLQKKAYKNKDLIKEITIIIPEIKSIFIQSWKLSSKEKGVKRLQLFIKAMIVNIF